MTTTHSTIWRTNATRLLATLDLDSLYFLVLNTLRMKEDTIDLLNIVSETNAIAFSTHDVRIILSYLSDLENEFFDKAEFYEAQGIEFDGYEFARTIVDSIKGITPAKRALMSIA